MNVNDILELGRWAPSGDNTQPWRFEIVSDRDVLVHAHDTRRHSVYDLEGHASQIAVGALLETIVIAATAQKCATTITRRIHSLEERPVFEISFRPSQSALRDPLVDVIRTRTVQRRALSTARLTSMEKAALESAVGAGFSVFWLEGLRNRLRATHLTFNNAKLRLTLPEAYPVHRNLIDWKAQFSDNKIPERAVGVDPITGSLMRWLLASWGRIQFFNRFLAGTWLPRLELEVIPGIACGAHAVLLAQRPPATIDDFVTVGRRLQRFWLTATSLGIQMQPEVTPLIFSRYARDAIRFTEVPARISDAMRIRAQIQRLLGSELLDCAVFMMRLGKGQAATARSLRLPLSSLLVNSDRRH